MIIMIIINFIPGKNNHNNNLIIIIIIIIIIPGGGMEYVPTNICSAACQGMDFSGAML